MMKKSILFVVIFYANLAAFAKPSEPLAADAYCIIDISAGANASRYPVSYMNSVPLGGWTTEYKTTKLVLRKISAGSFMMGSPAAELGRLYDEDQHSVTLTKDFWIGVFEVTQKQWQLVMGTNLSFYRGRGEAHPVECVSYSDIRGADAGAEWPESSAVDASSFLGKLRKRTGLMVDLPTEAQWEYACRAGTTTALNSGKNLANEYQCPEMSEVARYWHDGWHEVAPTPVAPTAVGSYEPNAWGLYDMHGNVWEWCLDWYVSNLGSASATDPKGTTSGSSSSRVFRGGGWSSNARYCRCASRGCGGASFRRGSNGFRLALPSVE